MFYRWKRRYDEHGEAGLADRPRTPLRSPRATPPAVVSKILYLRAPAPGAEGLRCVQSAQRDPIPQRGPDQDVRAIMTGLNVAFGRHLPFFPTSGFR
jgi:hypothetical protein